MIDIIKHNLITIILTVYYYYTSLILPQTSEDQDKLKSIVLKLYNDLKTKQSEFAGQLKTDLDDAFGGPWHIVIGKSFSSSVSHEKNGFIYFYVDNLAFLCFKTA